MAATTTAALPTGWKADKQATARLLGTYAGAGGATEQLGGASMSTTASNGIYNFGASAAATDRAVGGLSSSSAGKTVNLYSPALTNSGSTPISGFTVAYDVERYRNGSNPAGFTLQLHYSTDGAAWTAAGAPFTTSLAANADNSGSTTAPLASSAVSGTLNVTVPAGGTLYLAWSYAVTSGTTTSNAQALGVDNISLAPLGTAPATPSITGLAPANGPEGTAFTVSGANLAGISSVTVGGVAATGVSATGSSVAATVASGTPLGSQPVVLSDGAATYAAGPFAVTALPAPTLTGLAPASGPAGTIVTLTGSNFTASSTVAFNGTPATQLQYVSATQLTAAVPASATSGYVTLTTAVGTASSPGGFTVTQPAYTLFEDFNRTDNTAVGNSWQETETAATGATLASNQLRLSSSVAGREFISRDVSARYSPLLSSNGPMTWAWNMQQTRTSPSGFEGNNYGVAFVLAASSADFMSGTGYAVVLGNSSSPDPVRLVRFSGGLSANSRLTTILTTSTDYTNKPLTLRVTYDPGNDEWTLAAASNTTAFQDPGTASYTALGAAFDDTYTGTALPFVGAFWNHATSATDFALFDNLYLTTPCVLNAEPAAGPATVGAAQLTSTTAELSWPVGSGTTRVAVLRAGQLPAAAPSDGVTYRASANLAQGSLIAPDEYVIGEGTATVVSLTGLQPNTTYFYRLYDGDGAGCALNYRASASAEGSFTTPPCVLASAPTQVATAASAAANGSYALGLTWTAGDGATRLVVVRADQAPGSPPVDGTGYAANARLGGGSAVAAGEFVVYSGTSTAVTVTGLTPGRTYYAAVYEFNGTGCTARYLTAAPATASAALPLPPASAYRFYRGNLHAHSAYSDGNKDAATSGASTPADDYALARQAMQFDFLGISEHNHSGAGMSLPNYARGVQQATDATQDGSFLALYGMEWGTISGGGHAIIYGYDRLIGWEAGNHDVYVPKNDYTTLFATVAQQPGAIAYLAHPNSGDYNGFFTNPRNETSAQAVVGLAMRSGPAFSTATDYTDPSTSTYEARYKDALKLGYHVGPTMDHDNHNSSFGRTTYARLVVLAPQLTRAALLEGLQQRRFYAADDYNVEVTLSVAGQPMGAQLSLPGAPELQVTVTDPDNEAVSSIVLLAGIPGSGAVATTLTTMNGASNLTFTDPIPNGATYYYYAVITQADGDKIWTAPIRYTRSDASLGTPLPVTWTSFRAVLQGESQAVLRWATAQEMNSAYYAVERSTDGHTFAEVGRVHAAGTSATARSYEWRDPQPLRQLTYYRLRQVDADGRGHYSAVAPLTPQQGEPKLAEVFPNPTAGQPVRLALRGYAHQAVQVQVTNMLGHTVLATACAPAAYLSEQPLALPSGLAPGVYVVIIRSGGQVQQLRLLVTR